MPRPRFRLLLIEDNQHRIDKFRSWLPDDCLLVVTTSAGKALGVLQRDRGYIYGGFLLDHDLDQQAATETDLMLSGSDLVESIVTHMSLDVPILVHSMNLIRGPLIAQRLNRAGFEVVRIPYDELEQDRFLAWLSDARATWEDSQARSN